MKLHKFLGDKILVIMRGIPGSGKSTRAQQMVGDGVIHSTDDLISMEGDYYAFFKRMKDLNTTGPLGAKHKQNLELARKSMSVGISPVIIDNTNIRHSDFSDYIKYADEYDYKVKYKNVGLGGLTAEQLADRNTHGVPLDVIQNMIREYNSRDSQGRLRNEQREGIHRS